LPSLSASLIAALPFFLLASIRVGVTFATLPAPLGTQTPSSVRLALTLLVTLALCIPCFDPAAPPRTDVISLAQSALSELFLGAVIGMTVRVMLAAAEIGGSAIGQAIGLAFASMLDPTHGETVLPTTLLLGALATLIFFGLDGHHALLAALAQSFQTVPVGHEIGAIFGAGVTQIGANMMARGMQIASPVIATMFIVQLGSALASRAAPRVHLLSFTFSVVVAAGILALFVAAPSVITAVAAEIKRIPEALSVVVGGSR
jgi:flagellar biosynthetic protein FliR